MRSRAVEAVKFAEMTEAGIDVGMDEMDDEISNPIITVENAKIQLKSAREALKVVEQNKAKALLSVREAKSAATRAQTKANHAEKAYWNKEMGVKRLEETRQWLITSDDETEEEYL